MLRTLRYALGAVVLLVAGTTLAQPPAGSDLYPFKEKSKWTYKVGDQTVEVEVTGKEKFDGKDCWKVETKVNNQVKASELYFVDGSGIYRVKVKDEKIDPPVKVLQLPATKGASWAVDAKVGSQSVKGTFKITDDKAKVKVKAGEFETVLVEGENFDIAGTKTTIKIWFAKDKGPVRLVYVIQGVESVLELEAHQ